ncbi:MAG: PTS sugar transporter subunit IIA [Deltaproteobacteria bacterium]|nr:MAG: PTS sugar transporter subunit IIA [Deltaproteobacteria bacterium]
MKLSDILSPDAICTNLVSKDKEGVLRELVDHLAKIHPEIDRERLVEVLLARERLGSTGLEHGVAIPHGKLPGIDRILACFGRSLEGVPFEAMDGKPSHIFFLLVAPENSAGTHLKVLARVSRLVKEPSFRKRLMQAGSREELYELIVSEDERF